NWRWCAGADYDGDGHTEMILGSTNTAPADFEVRSLMSEPSLRADLTLPIAAVDLHFVDLNGDLVPDLLAAAPDGFYVALRAVDGNFLGLQKVAAAALGTTQSVQVWRSGALTLIATIVAASDPVCVGGGVQLTSIDAALGVWQGCLAAVANANAGYSLSS